jgi:ABC-2 type transport system ATP-binding protein
MTSIEIKQASKSYGTVRAVREASLTVPENCLFGLIGPDGAGKTTLFRMITTLLVPDEGSLSVFGYDTIKDYRKIRLFTGYMPGRFSLYPDLTVLENLTFYAAVFRTSIKEHFHLIEPVYSLLEPFNNRLANKLSGGMKQKLALCCALIHNPGLLVLDEPTTGVDAVSRKEFWETLQYLKKSGMTILVSTPYMDEAARCDRIALMQEGRIMSYNTPSAILSDYVTPLFEVRVSDRLSTLRLLRTFKEIRRAYLFGQYIHIATDADDHDAAWLNGQLLAQGIADARITKVQADFEDCFIEEVENNTKHEHQL